MPNPKKKLDPADYKRIESMAATAVRVESQARILGIQPRTFELILKRDPLAKKAFQDGKAKAETMVTKRLFNLIEDGVASAIFFYLKTQCGWRETDRLEVVNGKPDVAGFKFKKYKR